MSKERETHKKKANEIPLPFSMQYDEETTQAIREFNAEEEDRIEYEIADQLSSNGYLTAAR